MNRRPATQLDDPFRVNAGCLAAVVALALAGLLLVLAGGCGDY